MSVIVTPAQVLSALKALRVKVRHLHYGICSNLVWQLAIELGSPFVEEYSLPSGEPASDIIGKLASKWPKFSGVPSHPVPVPDSLMSRYSEARIPSAEIYDYSVSNKWVGEYGELRRELLDFIIQELERDLVT